MNREIKFKAWDDVTVKKMSDPFEVGSDMADWYRGKDLFEFSGFQDKNGKDIYEGDILGNGFTAHLVTFRNGSFTLANVRLYTALRGPHPESANGWEVVGNIKENPELLVNHK